MSDHKKRELQLATSHRRATKGIHDFERTANRAERRRAEAEARKFVSAAQTVHDKEKAGGAGLLMDAQLREFWVEYNGRVAAHGLNTMPTSFNVVSAMMTFDEVRFLFRLLPEQDHLFSWTDFVDFVTSGDAPRDAFAEASKIPENHTFAFNAYDDPHDLIFSSGGEDYGVGGVSFVRHGNELSIMLVAGRKADLELERETIEEEFRTLIDEGIVYKPGIQAHPDLKSEAVALSGHEDLHKTIVLTRIDLAKQAEEVRYVLLDNGNRWDVATDDPSIFGDSQETKVEGTLDDMRAEVEKRAVLFDLCRTALLLPSYFAFKVSLVKDETVNQPTGRSSRSGKSRGGRPRYDGRVKYRTVSALRIINATPAPIARKFSPPQFRVEVDGFWRKLAEGVVGKDPSGQPVVGRTWVAAHERYTHKPERPIEVLVKSRVAIARQVKEAEARVADAKRSAREAALGDVQVEARARENFARVSREEAYRERLLLTPRLRWAILSRDGFRCTRCGADAISDPTVRLEVDHIDAIANGGKTVAKNLTTLCNRCNNGKGHLVSSPPERG